MSYQPIDPARRHRRLALSRSAPRRRSRRPSTRAPTSQRDVAYFEEKIGEITSAADLVADRRLLKVALGAFGLDGEIDKKAFIRKVLEEGTADPKALASRLTDKSLASSRTPSASATRRARTGGRGLRGEDRRRLQDARLRGGGGRRRQQHAPGDELPPRDRRSRRAGRRGASWYTVLGSKPLRQVFEKAFGLPTAFAQVDIDRQRDVLPDKTGALFGARHARGLPAIRRRSRR